MGPLIDPFLDNGFMLRALLAAVLVSAACAVVGTFIVLRGLAFIGDALAHGVLPGIAGALLLGAPGMVGAIVGALAMIGGITLITRRSRLSSDTAIGLLFVGMLSLGVVMVSRSNSFAGDLISILFGQILGTSWDDLWLQLAAAIGVAVAAAVCARPFLLLAFDPEQADVAGFSSRRYHGILLVLIALTVVVSFQVVGTLLVFGMLLAPAAAGALLAHRIGMMMLIAAAVGAMSSWIGLLLSYWYDLAAGATIVLVTIAIFFIVFTFAQWREGRSRTAEQARATELPSSETGA